MLASMVWENYFYGKLADRNEHNSAFVTDLLKELNVIAETGYSGYFLIVHEYIKWAKENGILVGDGRGSGAGCKVAYTIGITDVNPQKYNLLFERFLSPGREPDFDVDFSDTNAVFKHLQNVYGKENVARVGAFSRFTAKSAIRKVMSVFGYSMAEIAEIIALLPNRLVFSLTEALEENKKLQSWFEEHPDLLQYVAAFEGKLEHFSTHAGGVIICNGLTKMLPVIHDKDDKEKMIVALDKKELEKLGHYKFDILGLKALTLMENILEYTGSIDWHEVDFEDAEIYKDFCRGDVLGVFQLADQREKVIQQQPKTFEDLIAINALIRPGVCDWNEYLSARNHNIKTDLPEYMDCTHGLIVYQDQYLQLAQTYAGWDIAYSDKHIRKNKNILNDVELKEKWLKDTGGMEDLWETISNIVASGYGFNRAHSTSYAVLTFQTAYMKHYYPKEFYAAYMTRNVGDSTKLYEAIKDAKNRDIKIFEPTINESTNKFIPYKDGIMMSLTSIKGIGDSVVREVERLRPIESVQDLIDRRTKKIIKKNNLINLIKAGCFQEASRNELLKEYCGIDVNVPDYVHDRDVFEFYISDSPFESYNLRPFSSYNEGNIVTTVLLPIEMAIRTDKKGNEMAFVQAINDTDNIKLIVFATVWSKYKFKENELLLVKGKKDKGNLIVSNVEPL
jgi:DNA polymerase-3 subunit alpha